MLGERPKEKEEDYFQGEEGEDRGSSLGEPEDFEVDLSEDNERKNNNESKKDKIDLGMSETTIKAAEDTEKNDQSMLGLSETKIREVKNVAKKHEESAETSINLKRKREALEGIKKKLIVDLGKKRWDSVLFMYENQSEKLTEEQRKAVKEIQTMNMELILQGKSSQEKTYYSDKNNNDLGLSESDSQLSEGNSEKVNEDLQKTQSEFKIQHRGLEKAKKELMRALGKKRWDGVMFLYNVYPEQLNNVQKGRIEKIQELGLKITADVKEAKSRTKSKKAA